MKKIDKDTYVTLNDYSINLIANGKTIDAQIAAVKTYLDAFKGKTVKIPASEEIPQMSGQEALATFKKILDTLETQPLLTPYKNWNGRYALEPKKSTLQALATITGKDFSDADYLDLRSEFRTDPIYYVEKNGGYEFSLPIHDGSTE